MYTLIIILGLLSSIFAVFYLKNEFNSRNDFVRKVFNMSCIGVYNGCDFTQDNIVHYYPIRSTRYTCGRKPRLSRIRVDITGSFYDKALSRDAALFFINDNGDFCIKRRKQKKIWIRDTYKNVYLICDSCTNEREMVIPDCFRTIVNRNQKLTVVQGETMVLHFGYRILMGKTLFEYNSSEVLNEKIKQQ